jgi:dTDP-4-amino-4,6-dideoxyglucose formyltransferase
MKTLVLTDNPYALALTRELQEIHGDIDVFQSPNGTLPDVPRLSVRERAAEVSGRYGLVISIHCKQIFPADLIHKVRCVNVHPGLNPSNRGWYPQVFSIINKLPAGVTIHEIDEQLDHGPTIAQREYMIEPWDTSGSVYRQLMKIERELVLDWFPRIRDGAYQAAPAPGEGNINYRKDFENLKLLDLRQVGTFGEFLDRLRALTHEGFRNAHFVDGSGRRVFVRVALEPEDS